jgi:hypothetical protein
MRFDSYLADPEFAAHLLVEEAADYQRQGLLSLASGEAPVGTIAETYEREVRDLP